MKVLARLLRHDPSRFGVQLDRCGWGDLEAVAAAVGLDRAGLLDVVSADAKGRFVVDSGRIRAAQGHSFPVDLGLSPLEPPTRLWHGTVAAALPAIRIAGLLPMKRRQVHLSADVDTATRVGRRRGRPIVLEVRAAEMWFDGLPFYRAENGVWLADAVPAGYLVFP